MKKTVSIKLSSSLLFVLFLYAIHAQEVTLGAGNSEGITVITSSASNQSSGQNTMSSQGFLPNLNAASRFLSQASYGGSYEDIQAVSQLGIEDWMDQQMTTPRPFSVMDKVLEFETGGAGSANFDMAWWQYTMTSPDVLRQRVALALSEIMVISKVSEFGQYSYAFGTYYDILADNAFGNYRDLLEDITYHAAMGRYLTYVNNPKTNTAEGTFPDENYAREIMQLFSIGLFELNLDGTDKLDGSGNPIPTYDNVDISEFAKIFTGLTFDNPYCTFGCSPRELNGTYLHRLEMVDEQHEPGNKNLLNGFTVPNRNPVDGNADIADALDNLFNHPNVGPFFGRFLIQRLVTSNPSPAYVERVASAFNGNSPYGNVRGDMVAVIKAIYLDEEARSCFSADDITYGKLREPFIRYVQLCKSFDLNNPNQLFTNNLEKVFQKLGQRPFNSPSVFNFFQSDFQPIGPVTDQDKVAPEFQIINSQSIYGYYNGLHEWLIQTGNHFNDSSDFDFTDELVFAAEDELTPQLLERLNLILAHGKLTEPTLNAIAEAITHFEPDRNDCNLECIQRRVRIAVYLVMSSPEYLINR